MKSAVQKVLEVQEKNSAGYKSSSNRRPVSMIIQSNSELNLSSENFKVPRKYSCGTKPSGIINSDLQEEDEDYYTGNGNSINDGETNVDISIGNNAIENENAETQIIRPIARRAISGKPSSMHSHSSSAEFETTETSVTSEQKPTNNISSNVKTTKELLQRTKSSEPDPTAPVVRLRNPNSRGLFRTRPQSLIENSTSGGGIASIYRPSSVTSSYTKSPSIKPLKGGSPIEDGTPQSYTPVNRVASNTKLLNKIQRQKLQGSPAEKTMSLDELQPSHKLWSRRASNESVNSNVSNSTASSKKVIFDAVSKQFLSPAEAYTQGLIDVNTFNRSRRDKTRLLFPKSRSVTSINSSEDSATNEITGSNRIRKMCIHDRKSNEVLNLDEAFSRGITEPRRITFESKVLEL